MINLDLPHFSNTCGKLFADKIILATSNKESEIDIDNVKSVAFTSRPKAKSLLFIAFPLPLFAMPFFMKNDLFIEVLLGGIGLVLLVVSITQANKKHTLSLKLKDGTSLSINVWEGNRKEAQKFSDKIKAKLSRRA